MLEEDLTYKEAIQDLLKKEVDSQIYSRLGLNYGKAVRFRNEFSQMFPLALQTTPAAAKKSKPSMGKLESYPTELKRLHLEK